MKRAFPAALFSAVRAGIVAGIVSAAVELPLWWMHGDPLPSTLYRDARFAAAIVMGPSVLPPPATFDAPVFVVAGAIHFALSILYAAALGPLVASRASATAATIGGLYGAALYALNMHGFTMLYPWFEATRDPVTFAAHVVFGVSAALALRRQWKRARDRRRRL